MRLSALAIILSIGSAQAERWGVEIKTNGVRFEPPIWCVAAAPSNPQVAYVGTRSGKIMATRDGGQTWEESQALVTAAGNFIGARRTQVDIDGAEVRRERAPLLSSGNTPGIRSSVGQLLAAVPSVRSLPVQTAPSESIRLMIDQGLRAPDGFRRYRVAAPNWETRTRGWLGFRLGSDFGYLSRVSLKSLLFFSAAPAVSIHFLDVHPSNPDDVLAATANGLLRSRDGGYSWPTALSGATRAERHINHVARDPLDPNHLLVATQYGIHESRDGGDTFSGIVNGLTLGDARWVAFHPTDQRTWYVGMSWALLRTQNGGQDFSILHLDPWPAYSLVRQVLVDPDQPRRIFIATDDGLARSEDDGKTFQRAGGSTFIGSPIVALTQGPAPGHVLVATERDLWESRDSGATWQIVLIGSVQWRISAVRPAGEGAYWLVNDAEILRLSRQGDGARIDRAVLDAHRSRRAGEPALRELIHRALTRAGVHRDDVNAARARIPWSLALPRVALDVRMREVTADYTIRNLLISELEPEFLNTAGDRRFGLQVFALWDLDEIIWRNDSGATERYYAAGQLRAAEWAIRETVVALYTERDRLLLERLADPRPGPRAGLLRDLRLEQLTAHLNALVGDAFEPFSAL